MRLAIGFLILILAVFFAYVIQEFIPPITALHGARVVLVPMIFCYAAMVMPTWAMLLGAFFTGFITDLNYVHVVDGQVEIALGWSIVFFVFFGLLANGFQPAFKRGHWWLHVVLSALGTATFLALQFAMVTFRRDGFVINDLVAWRILAPAAIAAAISPLLHLAVVQSLPFLPADFEGLETFRRS